MEMEEDNSPARFSPQERERIVLGFEAWLDQYLDRAMADEQPPQGLTDELLAALENGDPLPPLESDPSGSDGCDLYSLWAAMTALTQEVRLQGRTFKQLNETLNQRAQSLEASAADTRGGGDEAARAQQAEARPSREQEIHLPLNVLLDLRDRVERGGNTARNAAGERAQEKLPFLARLLGVGGYASHIQGILAALSHGYTLTLDTLDESLVGAGVSRIACQGQIFDPRRMTAVDIEETSAVPEGTVVEVYRNGYEWNGEVHRSAQVKVARSPERKSE
jgi:molecular chaperone GrpE